MSEIASQMNEYIRQQENFQKMLLFFLFLHENIFYGYLLEAP